jgi:hypothetical protein
VRILNAATGHPAAWRAHLIKSETIVIEPTTGTLISASPGAWRLSGHMLPEPAADPVRSGEITRWPAETFRSVPRH